MLTLAYLIPLNQYQKGGWQTQCATGTTEFTFQGTTSASEETQWTAATVPTHSQALSFPIRYEQETS